MLLKSLNSTTKCYFNLYLVRHGETDENKVGIVQGQSNTKLSEIGIEQARRLGQRLTDTKFTHVYSSDLDRAHQTACEILMSNSFPTSDIVKDKLLRERKFGVAEGHLRKELVEIAAKHGLTTTEFIPEGAESTFEVYQRSVKFFENLCKEMLSNTINNNNNNNSNNKSNVNMFDINSNDYESSKCDNQLINPNQLQEILNEMSTKENNDDGVESLSSSFSSLNSIEDASFFKNFVTQNSVEKVTKIDDITNPTETPSSGVDSSGEILSSPQADDLFSEILVVSHGALIREVIKYFVYDLRCEIQVDPSQLKIVPGNTAISKFTVCVTSNENELPKVTCHLFNDREHLAYTNLETKTLCNM